MFKIIRLRWKQGIKRQITLYVYLVFQKSQVFTLLHKSFHVLFMFPLKLQHPRIKVLHTAYSINVVGLKLQAFESRLNGGMGIYWNLHVRKSTFARGVFFFFVKPFLYLFARCYVVRIILFKCTCGEEGSFLYMSEEKGNAKRLVCPIAISQ